MRKGAITMGYGYTGNILHIDLSSKKYWIEHPEENFYRTYWGLLRVKVYLGFKISPINCKRSIKGLMNRPISELSTLLYNYLFSLFSFQITYQIKFAA